MVGWPIVSESGAAAAATAASASTPATDHGPWQRFNADRVAQLAASGRPVFVDFTAAWCVTCQVNKQLVLNTDAIRGFNSG
jgi:thiol:disulfide interchange protein